MSFQQDYGKFKTLEDKKYAYDDGSTMEIIPWPKINYEQSVDGGEMAREQERKRLLDALARQTYPRYLQHERDPLTNLDNAINYQRQEIDEAADWWKSLGRTPGKYYPNNYPYKDLATRIDAVKAEETANNFLDYANAEASNPTRKPYNLRNPEGLINAYVNNLYNKLMNK